MNEEEQVRQADYNSAQYAIDRVNVIKNDLHLAKITKRFSVWIDLLFNYLSEVSPQMSREQEDEYKKQLREARSKINQPHGLKDVYKDEIYDSLFDVELDLERFYDSRGNKFRYTEERREVSFDEDELADLRKYGGGGDWANLNKN